MTDKSGGPPPIVYKPLSKDLVLRTIYRYVLWEMLPSFLLCVTLLTFLFMINKVFLSLDLVLNKKVSVSETLLLYISLIPFILSLTIPMAMMVGTLLAFGRLSSDMEVTAFKSGGGHLFHLIAPILTLGFLMTCLMSLFQQIRFFPPPNSWLKKSEFNIVKKSGCGHKGEGFYRPIRGTPILHRRPESGRPLFQRQGF